VLVGKSGEDKADFDFSDAAASKSPDLAESVFAVEFEDISDCAGRIKGRLISARKRIEGHSRQDGLEAVDRAIGRDRVCAVEI